MENTKEIWSLIRKNKLLEKFVEANQGKLPENASQNFLQLFPYLTLDQNDLKNLDALLPEIFEIYQNHLLEMTDEQRKPNLELTQDQEEQLRKLEEEAIQRLGVKSIEEALMRSEEIEALKKKVRSTFEEEHNLSEKTESKVSLNQEEFSEQVKLRIHHMLQEKIDLNTYNKKQVKITIKAPSSESSGFRTKGIIIGIFCLLVGIGGWYLLQKAEEKNLAEELRKEAEKHLISRDSLKEEKKKEQKQQLKSEKSKWIEKTCSQSKSCIEALNKIEWVYIKGGRFDMGSNQGKANAKPVHQVTLSSFEMMKTEITLEMYNACQEAGQCSTPWNQHDYTEEDERMGIDQFCSSPYDNKSLPQNCLTFQNITEFARWVGARVPSEAEWEYAARGQGKDIKYPWGNQKASCQYAVINEKLVSSNQEDVSPDHSGSGCNKQKLWPVCSKPLGNTADGLCDMGGNVQEWTVDTWHNSYIGAPTDGSSWVDQESDKLVIRGGAWYSSFNQTQVSARTFSDETSPHSLTYLGGRLVRDVSLEKFKAVIRNNQLAKQKEENQRRMQIQKELDEEKLAKRKKIKVCQQDPLCSSVQKSIQWIKIEGSSFNLGIYGSENMKPSPYKSIVSSFEIMKTEITVGMYAACVQAGKCKKPKSGGSCNWGKKARENHPINCITYDDLETFADWILARFPSESEWEYAARSQGQEVNFPWLTEKVSCKYSILKEKGKKGCRKNRTWPVCSKSKGNTQQDVCDMVGNVAELTQAISPVPGEDPYDMIRGGSWKTPISRVSIGSYETRSSSEVSSHVGARLVRDQKEANLIKRVANFDFKGGKLPPLPVLYESPSPSSLIQSKQWYCVCYKERVNGVPTVSTACRSSSKACLALQAKIQRGSKFLVAGSAGECAEVDGNMPWNATHSSQYDWRPSKKAGSWWSPQGCFVNP